MSGPNKQPGYLLRAPAEELDAWRDAADGLGVTLAEWIRDACNQRLRDMQDTFPSYFEGAAKRREPPEKRGKKPARRKAKR